MKTKPILTVFLAIMAGLILLGILFRDQVMYILNQPALHSHALFIHIAAVTLFFANAVIGIIWESRALASCRKEVILHTYTTVSYLDARLSSPLIVVSVVSGIMLSAIWGNMMETGWLFWSFILFLVSGLLWVLTDISTQRKVKNLMNTLNPAEDSLPAELIRLLKLRLWVGIADVSPLLIVFIFMVYKPYIPVPVFFMP